MTTSQRRRVYWDTGLFLSFINKNEAERRKICEDNLRHARAGEIEIYTSYWTAVEVIRPKWIPKLEPLTDAQVEMIQGMFQWPFLRRVQVHQTVAFKAADLSRKYGLKPADAIHAATAIVKGVDAMQVFDRDFKAIAHLVRVEEPKYLTILPLIDSVTIGPTPEQVEAAKPQLSLSLSSAEQQPASQSPDDAKPRAPQPEPSPLSGPQAAQGPQQRDSSGRPAPPAQSEK